MKKKTEGRAVKVISFLSQTWRPKGEEFKQPYLLSSTYLYSAFILLHERNKIRNYFTQRKTTTVKNRNMLDEKLSHKVPLVRKSAFFFCSIEKLSKWWDWETAPGRKVNALLCA